MSDLHKQLNQGRQLLFLHIMKTGGNSLAAFLDAHFAESDICPYSVLKGTFYNLDIKDRRDELVKYKFIRGHLPYKFSELLPELPIFITFLRDPIERTVSLYQHFKREKNPAHRAVAEQANLKNIEDFVRSDEPAVQYHIWNLQTRQIAYDFVTTFDRTHFSDRELLDLAKSHLEEFAVVGLTERFDDSIKLFCHQFGWLLPDSLQRLNVTKNKINREELPASTINAIQERTYLDIELYQYACELFQSRYETMVRNLLQKHYELKFPQRNPERLQSITFDMSQALSGFGWHGREGVVIDGVWKWTGRWTGPGTRSIIDLRLSDQRDLEIKFHIIHYIAPDILESLTLKVNDFIIPTQVEPNNSEGITYRGVIPKNVLQSNCNFTRLSFQVNRTVSPKELNPELEDSRPLGVAITHIKLSPILEQNLTDKQIGTINPKTHRDREARFLEETRLLGASLQDGFKRLSTSTHSLSQKLSLNRLSQSILKNFSDWRKTEQ